MSALAAPELPVPATAAMVGEWLAAEDLETKFKALQAVVHPQFPVPEAAESVRRLAASVSHQARQFAAIAMGNGGAPFADDLVPLVGADQKTIVRICAAHALFRIKACPASAVPGLADMLRLESEPARVIAEAALANAGPDGFVAIVKTVREMPADHLNLQAVSALAHAAKHRTGAVDAMMRWMAEIAESHPPIVVRMAVFAAIARMTDGARGVDGLVQVVEEGSEMGQRRFAIEALGSLGEIAAPCRRRVLDALVRACDGDLEEHLYPLVVRLRTPANMLPVPFLLQRVAGATATPIVAGACMVLTLGGRDFERYADVVNDRYMKSEDEFRLPLAVCFNKLTGKLIDA